MEFKSFDVLLKALLSELDIKSINKTNPKGILKKELINYGYIYSKSLT
jgi:hypothetical protein